jgi:glycosyltransferase involved in cell wall biosynthesis
VNLSVVLITYNEEANLARTLRSVQPLLADGKGEIIVVDSHSTDRTVEIARSFGAKVFIEDWKGFAAQKNSAIDKAQGDWILSLDADEEVDSDLQKEIADFLDGVLRLQDLRAKCDSHELTIADTTSDVKYHAGTESASDLNALFVPRKNYFLGRWMKHGGFWPDPKRRLFRRGTGQFENRLVHEDIQVKGRIGTIRSGALLHHSYPTLADYIDHMNRYSSLGAEMAAAKGHRTFSVINIVLRPLATFFYNYIVRLGFLDGREGLLLHLYHAVYVSWKYAKAWEQSRRQEPPKIDA